MLKLSEYPVAIAQAAAKIVELDYELSALRQLIVALEGRANIIVVSDSRLKNFAQRKARRFELLQFNREYQKALHLISELAAEKSNAIAHLEYLRNEFSVAKLEARLAIAQQLCRLESKELVGL